MKRVCWLVLCLLSLTLTAHAASFDCTNARSKTEKLICGNGELSKLDEELSKVYQQALARSGDDKQQEIEDQRFWLKITHMSCKDVACLKEHYSERIHELTEYSYVPAHFGACETDTSHTMQQIIDGTRTQQINIGIVGGGVKSILRKDLSGPLTDETLVDFYRIPKGISLKPISGTYRNIRVSEVYILPEVRKEFATFAMAYGLFLEYEFEPKCEVITRQGDVMIAFRKESGRDRGTLHYVLKKDVAPLQQADSQLEQQEQEAEQQRLEAIAEIQRHKAEIVQGITTSMVKIPGKNYEIGKNDITQREWIAVMGDLSNFSFSRCGDNCPVTSVNWYEVQEFIQKLNAMTSNQYRLPTEAEWEYACYGGSQTEYCGSNDINAVAWYVDNSDWQIHPVGQMQANGYGLYDMSGNASQWMQDWFDNSQQYRSLRGGSWEVQREKVLATFRNWSEPRYRLSFIGFRLARTLPMSVNEKLQ